MNRVTRSVAALAAIATFAAGCSVELGGGGQSTTTVGTIPLDVQANFMNGCVGGGSTTDFCRCVLDYIEAHFGAEGLVDLDAEVTAESADTLPSKAQEAFDACV